MKTLFVLVILAFSLRAGAVDSIVPMKPADFDPFDLESAKRGAAYFTNYCLGCHSIKHLRYSRIGKDLKITDAELGKNIVAEGAKVTDSLLSAMHGDDAERWFGMPPPDLSLVARSHGADWLYNYLMGFYPDPTRPTGVNNLVLKDVAMPNVLWDLQGLQKPIFRRVDGHQVIERLELASPGKMPPAEFDRAINDLVNFLVYAGEPTHNDRVRLGKYVIFGLLILSVLLYKLKKEYWKDLA